MIRNQESWKVSERKKERKLRIDPTPERGRGKGGALGGGGLGEGEYKELFAIFPEYARVIFLLHIIYGKKE